MRSSSPIGAQYMERKQFTCLACGTFNRPGVRFCVKCGEPLSTVEPMQPSSSPKLGLVTAMKILLTIGGVFALFLGVFDPTLYLLIIGGLGVSPSVALLGTLISVLPSLAAFAALKEGILRKMGTLRQFDRFVFGDGIWVVFGVLFLILASVNFLLIPTDIVGMVIVTWIELAVGVLMLLHLLLRKKAVTSLLS